MTTGPRKRRTLQFGSVSRLCTLVSSVDTLCTGLHWSWIKSRHSVPSCAVQGEGLEGSGFRSLNNLGPLVLGQVQAQCAVVRSAARGRGEGAEGFKRVQRSGCRRAAGGALSYMGRVFGTDLVAAPNHSQSSPLSELSNAFRQMV